jgi:hypothetical protein
LEICTVSIEALAYVKTLDLGANENAQARLLLYVLGENTFNDTFICALSQEQLAFEAGRVHERTIRRHLDELCQARILIRKSRYRSATSSGRLHDAVRIVGFKRWYLANYGAAKAAHSKGGKPDKMSGKHTGQIARFKPDSRSPVQTGQQVSGTYKDTRNLPVKSKRAPVSAREDSIFDSRVKCVLEILEKRIGADKFEAWFSKVAFAFSGAKLIGVTADKAVRDWITKNYELMLLGICQAHFPDVTRVEFNLKTQGAAR